MRPLRRRPHRSQCRSRALQAERDCGGGAWVTGPLPLAGDGVSEPDDRKVEGVPSNRGISSGVTNSTTIASGRGTWNGFALTTKQPHDQGPQVADGRNDESRANVSLQSIHLGLSRYRPRGPKSYIISAVRRWTMKRLSCASWITCESGWVTSWKTCPPIALEPLRLCKIRSPARESGAWTVEADGFGQTPDLRPSSIKPQGSIAAYCGKGGCSCFSLCVCLNSDSTVLRRLTGSHQARGAPFRRWQGGP